MNKRILWAFMAMVLVVINTSSVFASPISDAKKKQKAAEEKLNDINEDIEDIEEEKELLEEEAELYEQMLVDLLVSIQVINGDISSKETEINEAQVEYDLALANQEAQKEAMNKRIKYMYEKGNKSYMEVLIASRNYTDAVNKATYSEKLYEYDRYQLYLYEQTKIEVMQKKEALEEDLTELEEIKADAAEQEIQLQQLIDEYSEKLEDFDDRLSNARDKATEYKNEIQKQSESIKTMEAEEKKKAEEAAKKAKEEALKKKAQEEARRKAEEEAKRAEEANQNNPGETGEGNTGGEGEVQPMPEMETTPEPAPEPEPAPAPSSSGSAKGQEIANFAVQFVGNPYVPGGTSLTGGADCSGFTMAVYQNFGISLPRTSGSQAAVGRAVSYAEAAPGDIIYYGGHVGIYIGNGLIVHASTQATGIKISNALYRSIISVRRIVE